jgi:hypothetical protein
MAGKAFTLDHIVNASRSLKGHDFWAFGIKNSERTMSIKIEHLVFFAAESDNEKESTDITPTAPNPTTSNSVKNWSPEQWMKWTI